MIQNNEPKALISHSWDDRVSAKKLQEYLQENKINCLDLYPIELVGEDITWQFMQKLEECDLYFPILSIKSVESKWHIHAIEAASKLTARSRREKHLDIALVTLEDCTDSLPESLQSFERFSIEEPHRLQGYRSLLGWIYEQRRKLGAVPQDSPEPVAKTRAQGLRVAGFIVLALLSIVFLALALLVLFTCARSNNPTQTPNLTYTVVPTSSVIPTSTVPLFSPTVKPTDLDFAQINRQFIHRK